MMSEIFRRLRPFGPVEEYKYVGFGSLWFSDFALFHRTLGIADMQSIEMVKSAKPRFEANKPFFSIKVEYEHSSKVLPTLPWDKRAFVWLDYEDSISTGILLDIQAIVARATSGTVLALSAPCRQAPEVEQALEEGSGPSAMSRFAGRMGPRVTPQDVSEEDLIGWPFAKLTRRIIVDQIRAALATRNLGLPDEQIVEYTPICEIEYEDGVKMTTTVGILTKTEDEELLQDCGFTTLDFLPPNSDTIRIDVPILTLREIRHIEKQLPTSGQLDYWEIPSSDADKFARFYRYLPNFAVLEH